MLSSALRGLGDGIVVRARDVADWFEEAGSLLTFALAGLPHYLTRSGFYIRAETSRQIYFTAVQGLPVILRAAVSLGILISFALFSIGLEGFAVLLRAIEIAIFNNLVPILVAFIVIGRSGTALTADVATFRIHQVTDTFAAMNLEPFHFLVLPRIVGITVSLLILTFWTSLVTYATCVLIHLALHISSLRVMLLESAAIFAAGPIFLTVVKVMIFGISIAVIHCLYGLRCRATIDIARNIPPAVVTASSWCMVAAVLVDIAVNV